MPLARRSRKASCRAAALRCCALRWRSRTSSSRSDEQFGVTIVRRACEEPVRQIVLNCGTRGRRRRREDQGADTIRTSAINASTEQYEDLVKAGVIDPTKVTRTALQNAASIASLMLTTEAMVCEAVEEAD